MNPRKTGSRGSVQKSPATRGIPVATGPKIDRFADLVGDIFDSCPIGIALSRVSDGIFIKVNDPFLEIFGYTRKEMIGHSSRELGLWTDTEELDEVVRLLLGNGSADDREIGFRKKSGQPGYLLVSAKRVEVDGQDCFLGMFYDITKRKRIEEAYRENELRYRTIVEDQTEVICRFKSDDTIVFVNEVFCRVFGKSREELLGKKWHPVIHPEDVAKIGVRLKLLSPAKPVVAVENRVLDASGEIRWMQFFNRGFFDQNGNLIEIQSVGRDITDRKLAEEALLRSEANYRTLFENSLDAIFLTFTKGEIRAANPAACRMFGMTEEELVSKGGEGITDHSDLRLQAAMGELAATGSFFGELTYIRKDGSSFPAETSSVMLDNGGSSFIILRDISARKKAEEELLNRQKMINAMSMELSFAEGRERFQIAELLHDQVAPKLFLVKMKVHSLIEHLPQGDYGQVTEAIDSLIDLGVEDIRSLTFQLRPPILAEMGLEAALKWLGEEFRENFGLDVTFNDDKKKKPLKYEMRYAIFQIVRELLLNVAKHAKTKKARISVGKEREMIVVSVEDDGIGFDTDNSSLISPRKGGFGIYSARLKIEYLGGELRIDSAPGHGTRVTITAPLDSEISRRESNNGDQDPYSR